MGVLLPEADGQARETEGRIWAVHGQDEATRASPGEAQDRAGAVQVFLAEALEVQGVRVPQEVALDQAPGAAVRPGPAGADVDKEKYIVFL